MDDQHVVLARQLDGALEHTLRRDGARRVVGVVDEHQPGALPVRRCDGLEIRRERGVGPQRHQHRLRARQHRPARIDGVARIRGERHALGVEKGEVEVEDALLGTERGHDLGLGVELDAEAGRVEARDGLSELGSPAV